MKVWDDFGSMVNVKRRVALAASTMEFGCALGT